MEATTRDPGSGHGGGNAGDTDEGAVPMKSRVADAAATVHAVRERLAAVLQGQSETIELGLACLLAGGHLLLEDVPGTGKTTLARAMARASGLAFQRVQMTADLLPSDITGARFPVLTRPPGLGMDASSSPSPGPAGEPPAGSMPGIAGPELRFVPGPIFSQVVLADELNRTPPRTQSALLEAMGEGHVTVEGEQHELPRPFFVVATQNPIEFAGTFPLPESQLDRFMMRLAPGYPSREAERRLLRDRRAGDPLASVDAAIDSDHLALAIALVDRITVSLPVEDYLLDIAAATRDSEAFELGASPRGVLDLDRAARAIALIDGRVYVTPDDVRRVAAPVLAHRLVGRDSMPGDAGLELQLEALLDAVPAPQLRPDGTLRA